MLISTSFYLHELRDGWMASLTRWTWVWVNSGSLWWTGSPGMLRFMGSQRVGQDWATELISIWSFAEALSGLSSQGLSQCGSAWITSSSLEQNINSTFTWGISRTELNSKSVKVVCCHCSIFEMNLLAHESRWLWTVYNFSLEVLLSLKGIFNDLFSIWYQIKLPDICIYGYPEGKERHQCHSMN